MFATLDTVLRALRRIAKRIDPGALSPASAARLIDWASAVERLAVGIRVRASWCVDDSLAGAEGENGPARWLASHTGQSVTMASRDIEASERLDALPTTDGALRDGELTAVQAHEVTSAAELDPHAEEALLTTARHGSVAELRRHAKRVRAAATDDEQKQQAAHANRDVTSTTDDETGEGRLGVKGPASAVATMLALLEPWVQAQFERARTEGRRERRGAFMFDALLAALHHADTSRRGGVASPGAGVPKGPPVQILARVDLPALVRGNTGPGEVCEIDGFGPVPIGALRELLPDAAIKVIIDNGVDVFNVTSLRRKTTAHQQAVLDWLGLECSRLGCTATRNLQIDHRADWAFTHVTQLRELDKMCPGDHRLKTYDGWALVAGSGKRPMVPPDHPDHPANSPPAAGDRDPPAAGDRDPPEAGDRDPPAEAA